MLVHLASLVLVAAVAFASPGPAAAQTSTPAPGNPAPSPEAISAGRDLFQAIMVDNGLYEGIMRTVSAQNAPEMRTGLLDSQLYRQANAEHRAALAAYADTLPAVMLELMMSELPAIGERLALRYAELMTAEELTQLAAFMRTEEARAMWSAMLQSVADSGGTVSEDPVTELSRSPRFLEFMGTAGGRAYLREQASLTRVQNEEFDAAKARLAPEIQRRLLSGLCTALEEECPARIRRLLGTGQPS